MQPPKSSFEALYAEDSLLPAAARCGPDWHTGPRQLIHFAIPPAPQCARPAAPPRRASPARRRGRRRADGPARTLDGEGVRPIRRTFARTGKMRPPPNRPPLAQANPAEPTPRSSAECSPTRSTPPALPRPPKPRARDPPPHPVLAASCPSPGGPRASRSQRCRPEPLCSDPEPL